MTLGLWYRGVSLQRVRVGGHLAFWGVWEGGELTEYWVVGNSDRMLSWNDALAWIDQVMEDEPFPDREKHHDHALPAHYCTECGQRDLLGWMDSVRDKLLATGLCHSCLHWAEYAQAQGARSWKHFVANGVAYTIGDTYKGDGYGGRQFHITWPCGHVEDTRNLWCSGDVPEHWRGRLPDSAELVCP